MTADTPPRFLGRLTWLVASLALGAAAYAAWRQGATYDEYFHLRWSERLVFRGETERTSNERWNSKTPVMIPGVLAEHAARGMGVRAPRALRFASRLPTLGWLAGLYAATFLFTRRCAGPRAGCLATIGVALDPSLMAHGSLATVDAAYALATLTALAATLRFAEQPRPLAGLLLGGALGFAFVAKLSAFVLLPGLALAVMCRPRDAPVPWRKAAAGLALAAIGMWLVLCAAYLFREIGVALGGRSWQSGAFRRLGGALPDVLLPLPLAFLTGIDLSLAHERGKSFPVYILGRHWQDGVWYYFLVLWLIKTPLLALLAQVLGLINAARAALLRTSPALRFLALNLAWQLAYFSLLFRAQIGYRFTLMCVPLAWMIAAAGLAALPARRPVFMAGGAVVLVAVVENALFWGNPLSFSSAAVWPKREAYTLMADSNLDWGQNRDKIAGWLRENGIDEARLEPDPLLPGANVLGVNVLTGVKGGFERQRWLRENVTPVRELGHTYLVFELDGQLYQRYRDEASPAIRSAAPSAGRSGSRGAPAGSSRGAP